MKKTSHQKQLEEQRQIYEAARIVRTALASFDKKVGDYLVADEIIGLVNAENTFKMIMESNKL